MTRIDAPSGTDSLQPNRTDFALLSPSARTSFTRVDVSAAEQDERGPEVSIQVEQARAEEPHDTSIPPTPQVSLTFLLVSGRRRTMSFDPEITIGRVKELAWNAWPNGAWRTTRAWTLCAYTVCTLSTTTDWQDERPPAPSYLRILYLGKILQDEDTLTSEYDAVGIRAAHRASLLQRSAFRQTYPSPLGRQARRARRR